jgi:DNA polymerase V
MGSGHKCRSPALVVRKTVIALCDCTAFYSSCEAVFEPRLWKLPTTVLSNNDGAIVALNDAAKAIGVKKFEPFFRFLHLVHSAGLQVRSSNYALYRDMSSRVLECLRQFSPAVEQYSIDEAFFSLEHIPAEARTSYARKIRACILQEVGIPTRIGIAETKTLAKVGQHFVKEHPELEGVLDITECLELQEELLAILPVTDVWGIGRRWGKFLIAEGIDTALKLRDARVEWVRQKLSVVGSRTVLELRGLSCLPLELEPRPRKSMVISRSFGRPVCNRIELEQALSTFTARAARKLRREGLAAGGVTIFASSNRFKEPYYSSSAKCQLWVACNHTPTLIQYVMPLISQIWKDGIEFKKAGILLTRITEEGVLQLSLFEDYNPGDSKPKQLMLAVDSLNERYGRDKIRFAVMGFRWRWQTRAQFRSNRWTTQWEEILTVKA